MARTAVSIDHQFNLIEDYAHTKLPVLAADVSSSFVTLQKPAQGAPGAAPRTAFPATELLSVSAANALMHFYHDGASPSGWNHEERTIDGSQNAPVDKLLGFYRGTSLYALAHYGAEDGTQKIIGMRKIPNEGWQGIPMDGQLASFIEKMAQTDLFETEDGRTFVYGISKAVSPGAFVLIEVSEKIESWSMLYTEMLPPNGAGYRLLPGTAPGTLTVMTIQGGTATFREADLTADGFSWSSRAKVEHDLGMGPVVAEQVFALFSGDGDSFLLQGQDNALWHISGYWDATPTIAAMTGGDENQPPGAKRVSIGRDASGKWMVFATATGDAEGGEDALWLLRQSAATGSGVAFEDWVPLGGAWNSLACPRQMSDGPEIFGYDLDSKVRNLGQSTASTAWFSETMAVPQGTDDAAPPEAPTYNHAITALDDQGNAAGAQVMTLRTDRPAIVSVDGVAHRVGPNTPLDVQTDIAGKLSLHTTATGLSAPAVTLEATWLKGGSSGPLRSDRRVHQRLAGKDPGFPVDEASLKSAGLMKKDTSKKVASAGVQKLQNFGTAALQVGADGDSDAAPFAFGLAFSEDGTIESIDTDVTDFDARHVRAEALSLGTIFGDIVHFLKNALDKLKTITVKVVDRVAHVVINGVRHLVHTVEGVASALELVIGKIASAVKSVVDAIVSAVKWLMELFHWEDIIHCKQVISHFAEATIKKIIVLAKTKGPAFLQKEFDTVKSDVTRFFDNLEKSFEKGASFNDQVPKNANKAFGGGGSSLDADNMHGYRKQNSVQMNYVHNKAKGPVHEKIRGAKRLGADAPGKGDDVFSQIEKAIGAAFDQQTQDELKQSLEKMSAWLKDIHSVKDFFDVAVLEFLELAKDIVLVILSVIEAVLIVLLEVAGDALTELNEKVLTLPLDIPIISWLYKKIAQHDLTILDVLSLLIAVPATLIYKIFFGGAKANPPFTDSQTTAIVNTPVKWPAIFEDGTATTVAAPQAAPAALEGASDDWVKVFSILAAVTWVEYGGMELVLDAAAASEDGEGSGVEVDIVAIAAIVAQLITQALAVLAIAETEDTETQNWLWGQWGVAFVPVALDVVSFACRKKITRFNGPPGLLADFIAGGLLLGVSCGALQTGKNNGTINTAGQVALVLPAIPLLFKPLIAGGDDPLDLAPLLVADLGGDYGTGIAGVISAFKS